MAPMNYTELCHEPSDAGVAMVAMASDAVEGLGEARGQDPRRFIVRVIGWLGMDHIEFVLFVRRNRSYS